MTIQRQTPISQGRHDYTRESALAWAAARIRADLSRMPPAQRREAIARACQRAAQRPHSYLAQHLKLLYGISRDDLLGWITEG